MADIDDDLHGTYSTNSQETFKNAMLMLSLFGYNDGYILDKGAITVQNTAFVGAAASDANKKVIIKICAPFTDRKRGRNNTKVDNAKGIDKVIPMYNFIEYSNNYSKISESVWKFYRDKPALNETGYIADFPATDNNSNSNNSALLEFKQKVNG